MDYTSFSEFRIINPVQVNGYGHGVTINLQNVPENTVLRISSADNTTGDLFFETGTEVNFLSGVGIPVTNGENVIVFDPIQAVRSGVIANTYYQFSNEVEIQGSITTETSPFDPQFYFNGSEQVQLLEESNVTLDTNVVSQLEAITVEEDKLSYTALTDLPSIPSEFVIGDHSVTELNDVSNAGSGSIITDAERTKLQTPASMTTNIRIIENADLTLGAYTAQLSDFANYAHTVFEFRTTSQVTFKLPDNIIPTDNIWTVKMFSGVNDRVLIEAFGVGKIDGETDHLLVNEEALTCIHLGSNVHRILSDYLFGNSPVSDNDYVNSATFTDNTLTLGRTGSLADLSASIEIHDVDNEVVGLPNIVNLNLAPTGTTRQTLNFGALPFQFTALSGGKLGVEYKVITHSQGGFEPNFISMSLDYGGGFVFTFDISNHELDVINVIENEIANIDYSTIYNTSPTVTVDVDVRGFQYIGEFEFLSLYNRELSIIHDEVVNIAQVESGRVEQELLPMITRNSEQISDINNDIVSIEDRLNHELLNLPTDVVGWLSNDLSITTHPSTTLEPSLFNRGLGTDGSQTVFIDANMSDDGTNMSSGAIKASATRAQKLFESSFSEYADGDTIAHAYDGVSVTTPLVKRVGDNIVGIKYIPAIPAGTTTSTHYPYPVNSFVHDWYTLNTSANRQAVATELLFVNDVPSVSSTLNVNYRYEANGGVGVTQSFTIANVGGASDVSSTRVLSLPDGETITVIVDWQAQFRRIRVEAIPNANNQNFFIFDTQVNMNYLVTENIPETPATTQDIVIGTYDGSWVFAIRPTLVRVNLDLSTLILIGESGEFDTGYLLNDLFGVNDDGHMTILNNLNVAIYDYKNFIPSQSVVGSILNRINLPHQGWFTENFNENNTAEIDTRMSVADSGGVLRDVFSLINDVDGKSVRATIVSDGSGKYEIEFTEL